MTSLGARFALVLVIAIIMVVVTSSLAAVFVLQGPRPERAMEPLAQQMLLMSKVAATAPADIDAAGMLISDAPAAGDRDEHFSDALTNAFKRTGHPLEASVTRTREPPSSTASLKLGDGRWLRIPMPDFGPPPDGWRVLTGWLSLIVAGSVLVSVFAASKLVKPLRLLENALGEVRPDGTIPHVPETGPVEIRATAQALNRLSARVKSATESRMRLVAAAGHDLRTPMTRMRLRAEFLADDVERAKWLADLEELDQIADSAIGLVREEVNRDGRQAVRLDRIVADIAQELAAMGMSVGCGPLEETFIQAGPLALTRALRNLLINAATHGRSAIVTVSTSETEAIVAIRDTGPGIPEDRLSQVFEPFFRIDIARQKAFPGAGLGLAIAKEIISRFDGSITVHNRQPGGLEQIVRFKRVDGASD
jgi:signal transduction histidine kinase